MKDIPEVGTGADCRNNAGWGSYGYCTPAAMARRVVVAESNPSCSVDVAKVAVKVAEPEPEPVRSWRCMVVVGLGCLEDEGGSFALRCSSRLLPYSDIVSTLCFGCGQCEYKAAEAMEERR